jgi:aspartokinase
MKTLASEVSRALEKNVYLLELLFAGLANISAVAERLRPSLEKELKARFTSTAVSMAIRRHLKTAAPAPKRKPFPPHIAVTTKRGLWEVAITNNERNRTLVERIRKSISLEAGEQFDVLQGTFRIVLATAKRNKAKILKLLGAQKDLLEVDDLACVTVNWPASTKDIPGIYYRITRALAQANISIQTFQTIGSEMTIFIKEDTLEFAHESLLTVMSNLDQV